MPKQHIGIIGNGNVGSALKKGLTNAGYDVTAIGNSPEKVKEEAKRAEIVFLAVPFGERQNALKEAGKENLDGKVLVDCTNSLDDDYGFAVDPRKESGAEQLTKWAPNAKVVKAFNTVFAQRMSEGKVKDQPLSLFVAADDDQAKDTVMRIGSEIGFEPVDAGKLQNARWLETLAMLNIKLGYEVEHGTDVGFRFVGETKNQKGQQASQGKTGGNIKRVDEPKGGKEKQQQQATATR